MNSDVLVSSEREENAMNLDMELREIPLEKLKDNVLIKKNELQARYQELIEKVNLLEKKITEYDILEKKVSTIQRYFEHPIKLLSLLHGIDENDTVIQEMIEQIRLLSFNEIVKDGDTVKWIGEHDELYKADKSKVDNKTIIMEERYWTLSNDKIFVQTSIQDMINFLIRDGIVSNKYNREDLLKDLGKVNTRDILFEYSVRNGHIRIDNYLGYDEKKVVIPKMIDGMVVAEIGNKVFQNCKEIEEIVLPNGIKRIGDSAFSGSGVRKINLPEGLLQIGECAFEKTKMKEIYIPSTLAEIPRECFASSKLENISFSKGISIIREEAFVYCTLNKVDIPESVKYIEKDAFYCGGVLKIRIPNGVDVSQAYIRSIDNYGKKSTIIYCNVGSSAMNYARRYGITVRRYKDFDLLED
jgi:hypothetical protein